MSDQIAHQDGDDVVIHRDHSYTDYYYSSPWLIATAGPCKLECGWKGGERSGLAQGQELTGRKKNKTSSQEERKTYLTLTGLLMEGLSRAAKLRFTGGKGFTAHLSPHRRVDIRQEIVLKEVPPAHILCRWAD